MEKRKLQNDVRMYLSRQFNQGWAPPDRLSVNLTLRCNLSCAMCTTCYDSPELSFQEIQRIIDEAADWGIEVFNPLGGEPFMRADIEDILRYATQKDFFVTLTTNATLISPSRAQKIARIPSDRLHFNISLDGDEKSNNRVRGAESYQKAIRGYQNLRQADLDIENTRRKILTNTILHAGNFSHFEKIIDEQERLGFEGVQILNLFRTTSPLVPSQSEYMWFTPEDMPQLEALCLRLADRAGHYNGGFEIQNTPEEIRNIPKYYTEALTPLEAPCWAGWKELYINADGKAIMCDGKLDFLNGAFGNVRQSSLKELWRSPELQARRQTVKSCQTPCIQNCYLRPDSDNAIVLIERAKNIAKSKLAPLVAYRQPWKDIPSGVLRLELSDVLPSDYEGRKSPHSRWSDLIKECPTPPSSENWLKYRDSQILNFGRGFMGQEILRLIIQQIKSSRLRFETLCLGWRGDPLIHPELIPILNFVYQAIDDGCFKKLRIESTGLFMTKEIAAFAARSTPQDWVLDLDNGDGAGVSLLESQQGEQTRIILKKDAMPGVDYPRLINEWPSYSPCAGHFPQTSTSRQLFWLSRVDHNDFMKDAESTRVLNEAAKIIGTRLNQPILTEGACQAPSQSLVVSWDAKATLCSYDRRLENKVGEVDSESIGVIWERLSKDRRSCQYNGRPQRGLCYDCGFLWSPNGP